MEAENIIRFKKLIDKQMESQPVPKRTGCGVFSTISTAMLGCGSRTRGVDCRYWPGAPAFPEKWWTEPGGLKGPVVSFFPRSVEVSESLLVSHPSSSRVMCKSTKDMHT